MWASHFHPRLHPAFKTAHCTEPWYISLYSHITPFCKSHNLFHITSVTIKMSESQRRLTSKRGKVTCSNCNETFNSDYTKKHMQKYHPALVKEGKTPSVTPVVETSQSTLSSFFAPKNKSDQSHQSDDDDDVIGGHCSEERRCFQLQKGN